MVKYTRIFFERKKSKLTRKELKTMSKSQIKGNIAILFIFYLLSLAILRFPQSIVNFLNVNLHINYQDYWRNFLNGNYIFLSRPDVLFLSGISGLSGAITLIFYSPLKYSLSHTYLKITESEKAKFNMLGIGYNEAWGKSILLFILIQVFTFLWSLLFIIPGIIKFYSYRMSFFILADNPEISAADALNESKRIMQGHKFDLFMLDVSFIWWYVLTFITLGIASIYVIPYVNTTVTNFYRSLK